MPDRSRWVPEAKLIYENTDVSSVPMEPATPYDPDPLAEKKEIEEPIIAKPIAKEKIDIPTNTINPITQITDITSENEDDVWTGTTQDVETIFETKLIEGIDTVLYRKSNRRFSGKMKIVDSTGNRKGELELVNGRMNGEELYFENEKYHIVITQWGRKLFGVAFDCR